MAETLQFENSWTKWENILVKENWAEIWILNPDGALSPAEKKLMSQMIKDGFSLKDINKEIATWPTKEKLTSFIEKDFWNEYKNISKENLVKLQHLIKFTPETWDFSKELFFAVIDYQKNKWYEPTWIPDLNAEPFFSKKEIQETVKNWLELTPEISAEIVKIISKHKKYHKWEWRKINREIAELFWIKWLNGDKNLKDFWKKFQVLVGSEGKNDWKIWPETINSSDKVDIDDMRYYVAPKPKVVHRESWIVKAGIESNVSQNGEQIISHIDSTINFIDQEFKTTKEYLESSKRQISKWNVFSYAERWLKWMATWWDSSKTTEQETYERSIQDSILKLYESLKKLRVEINNLQKIWGDQNKINEYTNKYSEIVWKMKGLNNWKNIPWVTAWQASWNSTKEAWQNIVNGKSADVLVWYGKWLGVGAWEWVKWAFTMVAHPVQTAHWVKMAIEMWYILVHWQISWNPKEKAQAIEISQKVADYLNNVWDLPPEKIWEKVGEIVALIIAWDKWMRLVGKWAGLALKVSKAYVSWFKWAKALEKAWEIVTKTPHKTWVSWAKDVLKWAVKDWKHAVARELDAAKHPLDSITNRKHIKKTINESLKNDSEIAELRAQRKLIESWKDVEWVTRARKLEIWKELKAIDKQIKAREWHLEAEITRSSETDLLDRHEITKNKPKLEKEILHDEATLQKLKNWDATNYTVMPLNWETFEQAVERTKNLQIQDLEMSITTNKIKLSEWKKVSVSESNSLAWRFWKVKQWETIIMETENSSYALERLPDWNFELKATTNQNYQSLIWRKFWIIDQEWGTVYIAWAEKWVTWFWTSKVDKFSIAKKWEFKNLPKHAESVNPKLSMEWDIPEVHQSKIAEYIEQQVKKRSPIEKAIDPEYVPRQVKQVNIWDNHWDFQGLINTLEQQKITTWWMWNMKDGVLRLHWDILADRWTWWLKALEELHNLRKQARLQWWDVEILVWNHEDFMISFLTWKKIWYWHWKEFKYLSPKDFNGQAAWITELKEFLPKNLRAVHENNGVGAFAIEWLSPERMTILNNMKNSEKGRMILEEICEMKLVSRADDALHFHTTPTETMLQEILSKWVDVVNKEY